MSHIVPDLDPSLEGHVDGVLARDVSHLKSSIAQIQRHLHESHSDLANVATNHYTAFVSAEDTRHDVSNLCKEIQENLSSPLPKFFDAIQEQSQHFVELTSAFVSHQKSLQQSHASLVPIKSLVSAPTLIDACIQTGYWNEAVEVGIKVRAFHKLAPSQPLVGQIYKQVQASLDILSQHVTESLRSRSLKFSSAIRSLDTLSRLLKFRENEGFLGQLQDGVDNVSLQDWFLGARVACLSNEYSAFWEIWLSHISSEIPEADLINLSTSTVDSPTSRALRKYIDSWREIIGDTISMYLEAFVGDSAPSSKDYIQKTLPLNRTLAHLVDDFIIAVSKVVQDIHSSYVLSQLVTQISHCSTSFAKRGLDFFSFSSLLDTISTRCLQLVFWHWSLASRFISKELSFPAATQMKMFLSEYSASAPQVWTSHLPRFLIHAPFLARWANMHTNALNTFRQFPITSLRPALLEKQTETFNVLLGTLIAAKEQLLHHADALPFEFIAAVSDAVIKILLPWCRESLGQVCSWEPQPLSQETLALCDQLLKIEK